MKRYYVVPKDVWQGNAVDLKKRPLMHSNSVPVRWTDMFHPASGSHYVELDDTHILLATNVEFSETVMDLWHGHPDVARLPHPLYEPSVTLAESTTAAHAPKKFTASHLDKLLAHPSIGASKDDTVHSLSAKVGSIHPQMKTVLPI